MEYHKIDITKIKPNPHQPRTQFAGELKKSIHNNGLLQPITVRLINQDSYEIIAGESRYRACKELGYSKIDCIILDATNEQSQILALIENICRLDLDTFELSDAVFSLANSKETKEIQKITNFNITKIRKLLSISSRYSDDIRTIARENGYLSIDNLYELSMINDDEKVKTAIIDGWTRDMIREEKQKLLDSDLKTEDIYEEEKKKNNPTLKNEYATIIRKDNTLTVHIDIEQLTIEDYREKLLSFTQILNLNQQSLNHMIKDSEKAL